jgi:hypothetical protein
MIYAGYGNLMMDGVVVLLGTSILSIFCECLLNRGLSVCRLMLDSLRVAI